MLNPQEKLRFRIALNRKMEEFTMDELSKEHNVGWMPENIEELMAEAAYNVLLAVAATNDYLEKEKLIRTP